MLPRLCVTLIIVFAIKNVFAYGQMHFVSYVEQRMIRDLRDRVFDHMARLPFTYFDKRPTGELMSNIMNDVNVISVTFQRVFTQAVRDPLTVLTLLVHSVFDFVAAHDAGARHCAALRFHLPRHGQKPEAQERPDSSAAGRTVVALAGGDFRRAAGEGLRHRAPRSGALRGALARISSATACASCGSTGWRSRFRKPSAW